MWGVLESSRSAVIGWRQAPSGSAMPDLPSCVSLPSPFHIHSRIIHRAVSRGCALPVNTAICRTFMAATRSCPWYLLPIPCAPCFDYCAPPTRDNFAAPS